MILTKWVQEANLDEVFRIRKNVFVNELGYENDCIQDMYDSFGKNVLLFDSDMAVGTGRLIFKDGKYVIDKVCVAKQFRRNSYGDLIIRLLVRKAVDMGAEDTYIYAVPQMEKLLKKIGFVIEEHLADGILLMVKHGDVCGHCCK